MDFMASSFSWVKKPKRVYEERANQVAFFSWLSLKHPKLRPICFHIQNGGKKTASYGKSLKLQGVTPGVCDIFCSFPMESKGLHGLYIEMKSKTGKTSESQKKFIELVSQLNYKVEVAMSVDEAIEAFEKYAHL